jgi:hypothetical protein
LSGATNQRYGGSREEGMRRPGTGRGGECAGAVGSVGARLTCPSILAKQRLDGNRWLFVTRHVLQLRGCVLVQTGCRGLR